jgi:hypothetical protein
MKKMSSISLIITLLAGLFWGCQKKGDPPVLPPSSSMTIDFSEFIMSKKSVFITEETNSTFVIGNINRTNASTVAAIWNTIIALNLTVPIASFKLAVNNKPVYLDSKIWEWKYSVNAVGGTFKVRLTGQIRTTDIKWEMYVSREGVLAYDEFLWFNGTSALDGKSGQWVLNHSQLFPEPILQIDWEVVGTDIGDIKYTYIRDKKDDRSTDPFKNSYIEYGLTANTLNAFYSVHLNATGIANDFKDVNIEWSTTNHNGRIKANYYFQDDLWHCWDGYGNDVTCN